jgi:TPR repeat protein
MYNLGDVKPQDKKKAGILITNAAEQGNSDAKRLMQELEW